MVKRFLRNLGKLEACWKKSPNFDKIFALYDLSAWRGTFADFSLCNSATANRRHNQPWSDCEPRYEAVFIFWKPKGVTYLLNGIFSINIPSEPEKGSQLWKCRQQEQTKSIGEWIKFQPIANQSFSMSSCLFMSTANKVDWFYTYTLFARNPSRRTRLNFPFIIDWSFSIPWPAHEERNFLSCFIWGFLSIWRSVLTPFLGILQPHETLNLSMF